MGFAPRFTPLPIIPPVQFITPQKRQELIQSLPPGQNTVKRKNAGADLTAFVPRCYVAHACRMTLGTSVSKQNHKSQTNIAGNVTVQPRERVSVLECKGGKRTPNKRVTGKECSAPWCSNLCFRQWEPPCGPSLPVPRMTDDLV